MRIIALMNQKGGVGKTTTTVNLGAALAELGQRVCLIDMDPQAHLTINYGTTPGPDIVDLYDVLVEERPLNDAMLRINDRVTLIPSSIDLAAAEIELVSVLGRELLLKRRFEAAQALAEQSGNDNQRFDFDFVLLDCPPSLGLLTLNALGIATEVLVPMQPHFLALQGMAKLLETVQLVNKRMNPKLRVMGIVLTMYDAQTKHSNEVVADLNGFISSAQGKSLPWSGAKVFNSKIRRNIKLAESPSFGETILVYEPTSNGAADYRSLARELLGLPEADSANQAKPAAPPKPAAPAARPRGGKTKAAGSPKPAAPVTVSINSDIDPSKLAAAKVPPPAEPRPAVEAPKGDGSEVAA
jgi:chromosome partitioning protein